MEDAERRRRRPRRRRVQACDGLHGWAEGAKVAGVVVGHIPALGARCEGGEERGQGVEHRPLQRVELHGLVHAVKLGQHALSLLRGAARVDGLLGATPARRPMRRRRAERVDLGLGVHGQQPLQGGTRREPLVVRRAQERRPVVLGPGGGPRARGGGGGRLRLGQPARVDGQRLAPQHIAQRAAKGAPLLRGRVTSATAATAATTGTAATAAVSAWRGGWLGAVCARKVAGSRDGVQQREVGARRQAGSQHRQALPYQRTQRLTADLHHAAAAVAAVATAARLLLMMMLLMMRRHHRCAAPAAAAAAAALRPRRRSDCAGRRRRHRSRWRRHQLDPIGHELGRRWPCQRDAAPPRRRSPRKGWGHAGWRRAVHAAQRPVLGAIVQLELTGGGPHQQGRHHEGRERGGHGLRGESRDGGEGGAARHRRGRHRRRCHRRAAAASSDRSGRSGSGSGRSGGGRSGGGRSGGGLGLVRQGIAEEVTLGRLKEEEEGRGEAARRRDKVARGSRRRRGRAARRRRRCRRRLLLPELHQPRRRRRLRRGRQARLGRGENHLRAGGHGRRRRRVGGVGRLRPRRRRRRRARRRRRLHLPEHVPPAGGIVGDEPRARGVAEEDGDAAEAGRAELGGIDGLRLVERALEQQQRRRRRVAGVGGGAAPPRCHAAAATAAASGGSGRARRSGCVGGAGAGLGLDDDATPQRPQRPRPVRQRDRVHRAVLRVNRHTVGLEHRQAALAVKLAGGDAEDLGVERVLPQDDLAHLPAQRARLLGGPARARLHCCCLRRVLPDGTLGSIGRKPGSRG